jgi:hypothetical protein
MRNYNWRTNCAPETARAIIVQMQQDIESGHPTLLELSKKRAPDLDVIRFLLQASHETMAIHYYRDCTEANVLEARCAMPKPDLFSNR